jgi:transposase-like protein
MAVKQKKRRWSAKEKILVCLQTTTRGVSVGQVARRYALLVASGTAVIIDK